MLSSWLKKSYSKDSSSNRERSFLDSRLDDEGDGVLETIASPLSETGPTGGTQVHRLINNVGQGYRRDRKRKRSSEERSIGGSNMSDERGRDKFGSESLEDEHGIGLGSKKRRQKTVACKFFFGKKACCTQGKSCSYSHDLEQIFKVPEKLPELCKFFKTDSCHYGRHCRFLHGEFPCKYFHKGECRKGEDCRFSHEPLNEITRPLYEKGESRGFSLDLGPTRKSSKQLLVICESYAKGNCRNGSRCPLLHGVFRCKDFHNGECSKGKGCHFSLDPHQPLNEITESLYKKMTTGESVNELEYAATPPLPGDSIEGAADSIEESPASPEPSAGTQDFRARRRIIARSAYRLIPIDLPPIDKSPLIAALLLASMTDNALRDDPRVQLLFTDIISGGFNIFQQVLQE